MSLVVTMMRSITMGIFPETCCTWRVSSFETTTHCVEFLSCELHPKVSPRGLSHSFIQCTTETQLGYNTQSQSAELGFSSLKMRQSCLPPSHLHEHHVMAFITEKWD